MSPDLEALVNAMLVKGRLYIDAIKARDEALVKTCHPQSTIEDEVSWQATAEAAEHAQEEYQQAVDALHAARKQR